MCGEKGLASWGSGEMISRKGIWVELKKMKRVWGSNSRSVCVETERLDSVWGKSWDALGEGTLGPVLKGL